MAKRIVIAGAGGFGRGVHSWITTSPGHLKEHNIKDVVFIDDGLSSPDTPVFSSIEAYEPLENDEVLCAIGNPKIRRDLTDSLTGRGSRFHTFVDDRAVLGSGVTVGEGTIICPGVVVSADASIGEHVHINFNCSIGHDVRLGAFATLSPSVNIMGEVNVGDAAFIGGSAAILPRIELGTKSTIGAGAVVIRSVGADAIMVGNPAKPIEKGW